MVNGFDMLHLASVHHRELVEPPVVERTADGALRLEYVSRVTGHGASDRVMKAISGNEIRVRQTCYGPTVVVEADLGRTRSCAVLGMLPGADGVQAFGAFGVPRGALSSLRAHLARWLYTAFLRRDFRVIEGMQLRLDGVDDPGVCALASYLRSLETFGV